jgi:putative phage-type endonuclease
MTTQRNGLSKQELSDEGEAPFEIVCHDTSAIERDAWLDLRRGGLGGSDIASAMGLSPFVSRYALWLDKIGEQIPFAESEYMKWGNRLEAPIALAFEEETGFTTWHQPVMLRSRSFPLALANPDRFTIDADGVAIVEIKNVGKHKSHEWVDGPPLHYRLQGQWYLFVSGHRRVYYAVLVGGQDFRIFQVERDEELLAEMLRQAEAFWTLVTLRRAPEVDESDSTTQALKAQFDTIERPSVEGGTELAVLVTKRDSVKSLHDSVSAQLQEIDNKIVALIGDAENATVDGEVLVRRPSQSRTTLDTTALKRDYPELASEYAKTSSFRVLKFPKSKESK